MPDFRKKIADNSQLILSLTLGKKCYWMILFLFGSGFTFKGIADVFINYYQFEVTTSTDVTTKDSVTFPAISICNLNKY